jgi:hypothetical protein
VQISDYACLGGRIAGLHENEYAIKWRWHAERIVVDGREVILAIDLVSCRWDLFVAAEGI